MQTTELIVPSLTGSTYLGGTSANRVFVELQSDQKVPTVRRVAQNASVKKRNRVRQLPFVH
jgi:hypothetical protein